MRLTPLLIALPLLAACNSKADDAERTVTKTVVIDQEVKPKAGQTGFSIDTDEFKASLDIPGMEMGGKDFDIDGMTLLPGSKVRGMKVVSREAAGKESGVVTVTFTSPAAPAAVLAHAEAQARKDGWSVARTDAGVGATKGDKSVAYIVVAAGQASDGTVTITGD